MEKIEDPQSMALSKEAKEQFFKEGFIVIKEFFTLEEVKEVKAIALSLSDKAEKLWESVKNNSTSAESFEVKAVDKEGAYHIDYKGTRFVLSETSGGKIKINRIVWAGSAEPRLLKEVRQPKLLTIIAQLLGSTEADQLINQLHLKIPGDEVEFGPHQDVGNRRMFDPKWQDLNGQGSFVQSLIAIDPMTKNNGPIEIFESSPKYDIFLDKMTPEEKLETLKQFGEPRSLILNPGDLLLMGPYLIHQSGANDSNQSRILFINGFAFPGANKEKYPGNGSAEKIELVSKK